MKKKVLPLTDLFPFGQVELIWRESTECLSKLICSKLEGNICGNYGIQLTILNKNATIIATRNVCRIGQVRRPGLPLAVKADLSRNMILNGKDVKIASCK